jgi:hypothetical protein
MNNNVADLLEEYKNNNKSVFREKLVSKVKNDIKWDGKEQLRYGDSRVSRVLLLHNVITMLFQNNKTSRFPFSYYIALGKYDIEHIHPKTPKVPNFDLRKDWLDDNREYISDKLLLNKIDGFTEFENEELFQGLYDEIETYFSGGIDEKTVDDLSNLALLDAHTNRGYHNDFFHYKRIKILHEDQEGTFIPICTKRVFQKYYTKKPKNMTTWNRDNKTDKNDRESYFDDIKTKLSEYLTEKNK